MTVSADGSSVFNQLFNREEGDGYRYGYGYGEQSLCGADYPNSIALDHFAEFDHTSETVAFGFDTAGLALSDQNWGICDLNIYINSCPLNSFDDGTGNCVSQCALGTYPSSLEKKLFTMC